MTDDRPCAARHRAGSGRWWGAGAIAAWAAVVPAADLHYHLGYGVEHSSNIRRVATPEEQETISRLTMQATYREDTRAVRAQVTAMSEYRDYRHDVYDDETVSNLDGTVIWTMTPSVSWTVADSYRNVPAARTLPDTPANRENTNVFTTGPTVQWQATTVDTLVFDARYGEVDAERSDIDNTRRSGALRWLHRRSATSDFSLNYETLRVDYDNDAANIDYRRHDYFIRGHIRPGRNAVTLEVGATDIERTGLPPIDGSLTRLTLMREVSTVRRLGLILTSQYTDTSADLSPSGISNVPAVGVAPITPEILTSDVYYTKRAETYFEHTGGFMPWSVRGFVSDVDYETRPEDVEQVGGRIEIGMRQSSLTGATLYSSYVRSEQPISTRIDRDREHGLRYVTRLSQSLSLTLQASRFERHSTDASGSFTDDRVLAFISYSGLRTWRP